MEGRGVRPGFPGLTPWATRFRPLGGLEQERAAAAQSCARQRITLRFFLLQAAEFLESETLRYPLLSDVDFHAVR